MRKRDGNIYELRDLIDELGKAQLPNGTPEEQRRVGADVARFFYLMRSHDTHMDFDIDLATKQSDENPVFYVQYAHARICSVIRKAEEAHGTKLADQGTDLTPEILAELVHPREMALVKKILDLPTEVERCAKDFGVHRLTTYAVELARTYHHFYDACRVIQPDQPKLSRARLALCEASRLALQSTLDLLGVSAPLRMERAALSE
jgi:arginyl-tRNA synthetase